MQVNRFSNFDATLADICIGSFATPTYLPVYFFTNQDKDGKTKEFNLIDGGVASNSPILQQ